MKINFNFKTDFDISVIAEIIEEETLQTKYTKSELNRAIKQSVKDAFKSALNEMLGNMYLDTNIVDDLKCKSILFKE